MTVVIGTLETRFPVPDPPDTEAVWLPFFLKVDHFVRNRARFYFFPVLRDNIHGIDILIKTDPKGYEQLIRSGGRTLLYTQTPIHDGTIQIKVTASSVEDAEYLRTILTVACATPDT